MSIKLQIVPIQTGYVAFCTCKAQSRPGLVGVHITPFESSQLKRILLVIEKIGKATTIGQKSGKPTIIGQKRGKPTTIAPKNSQTSIGQKVVNQPVLHRKSGNPTTGGQKSCKPTTIIAQAIIAQEWPTTDITYQTN